MDYYDEDPRPRLQVHKSGAPIPQNHQISGEISKTQAVICTAVGILILGYAFLLPGALQIFLAWIGISLIIGPFAPVSLTGGEIRVGAGEPLEEIEEPLNEPPKAEYERKNQRGKNRRSENPNPEIGISNGSVETTKYETLDEKALVKKTLNGNPRVSKVLNSEEWSAEEVELLRKQIGKNPPGKPGRWEVIAETFGGTRTVDSVIRKAKSLGEKNPGDDDSYSKFLAQRKVSDRIAKSEIEESNVDNSRFDLAEGVPNLERDSVAWSNGDDQALLGALKAFPKDTNMRWEKIAAAVPGKSKSQCMKRFSELKQNFRNSKSSET